MDTYELHLMSAEKAKDPFVEISNDMLLTKYYEQATREIISEGGAGENIPARVLSIVSGEDTVESAFSELYEEHAISAVNLISGETFGDRNLTDNSHILLLGKNFYGAASIVNPGINRESTYVIVSAHFRSEISGFSALRLTLEGIVKDITSASNILESKFTLPRGNFRIYGPPQGILAEFMENMSRLDNSCILKLHPYPLPVSNKLLMTYEIDPLNIQKLLTPETKGIIRNTLRFSSYRRGKD